MEAMHRGAVIVSDPYAYRHGLRMGTRCACAPTGRAGVPVAGVYYDYSSTRGCGDPRETFERFWDDRAWIRSGSDSCRDPADAAIGRIRRSRRPTGPVRSNRSLREASLKVFDRTFAVTNVLRSLTILIAFVGS